MPEPTAIVCAATPGKNLTFTDANGCLKLSVLRMNMRQVVVLVVDEVQANDDPVKHGNDRHD
jgi:hypothetical protein